MKAYVCRLGMKVCIAMLMETAAVQAVVITDNNLSTIELPDVANTNNDYAVCSFPVSPRTLCLFENHIESTQTGTDMSDYIIEGVSRLAVPTARVDFISYFGARTLGIAYTKVLKTFSFVPDAGVTTLYFGVGFGRFDTGKAANYRWLASEIKVHQPAMADADLIGHTHGNLVPNAGFENEDLNFWSSSMIVSSTNAVQGTMVLEIPSVANSYIAIPVMSGETYCYSFWSSSPEIGSGHKFEYGFSIPGSGWAVGTGNTFVSRLMGGGNVSWKEYTGTFVVAEGQTLWYIGGMANGGRLQFDSVYVARVAKVGTVVVIR